jgi:hypothetical protein
LSVSVESDLLPPTVPVEHKSHIVFRSLLVSRFFVFRRRHLFEQGACVAMIRRPGTHCESTRSRRGGFWCALLAAAFVFPWLAGCDKLPKASEFMNKSEEEKKEEPKAAQVPAPQPSPTPVKPKAATPPVPKKRTPQEVIGDFNRTKPQEKTDGLLANWAQVEDGLDQVTRIDVKGSKVTDTGLRHIEKLDSVTTLNLGAVGFTNPGLESVAKMKNVEDLSLESTPIAAQAASSDPKVRFLDSGLARLTKMRNHVAPQPGQNYREGAGRDCKDDRSGRAVP